MPTLQSHTHCQAAQASRTSQSLSKRVSFPTHGRKESTGIQQGYSGVRLFSIKFEGSTVRFQRSNGAFSFYGYFRGIFVDIVRIPGRFGDDGT